MLSDGRQDAKADISEDWAGLQIPEGDCGALDGVAQNRLGSFGRSIRAVDSSGGYGQQDSHRRLVGRATGNGDSSPRKSSAVRNDMSYRHGAGFASAMPSILRESLATA